MSQFHQKIISIHRRRTAIEAYADVERRSKLGEQVEAVLVSAGPVEALKKAYPNYFLDTHQFVSQVGRVVLEAQRLA